MRTRLIPHLALARRIFTAHWFQPATALWRVHEAAVVRDHLSAGGTALDLGCGDGTLANILIEKAGPAWWIGVDLEVREVGLARSNGPYGAVYAASAERLPQHDGSVDLVFANSAFEHMENLERVVGEAQRILAPGGRLVFTVPTPDLHRCLRWPRILERFGMARQAERYRGALDRRLHHLHYLAGDDWADLLGRHGFEVRRRVPYLSARVCAWWEFLSNLTGGLAYHVGGGRRSPRDLQHRAGLALKPNGVLGLISLVLMLPILLSTAHGTSTTRWGALFLEAVKAGNRNGAGR